MGELDQSTDDLFFYVRRLDSGKTRGSERVDYAVFDKKGEWRLFKDRLPRKAVLASSLVVVFNPERAKRPRFLKFKRTKFRRFEPGMISSIPQRSWFSWRGPSGNKWSAFLNRFPILPQELSMFDGNRPFNSVVARSDSFVHQRSVRRYENLLDLFTLLVQINRSPLLKPPRFRLGINGWYYSDDKKQSRTATLSQAHGQIIRFDFPIEKTPTKKLGAIGEVKVLVLDDPKWGAGFVLDASVYWLSQLATITSRILEEIIKEGNSFTVFVASSHSSLRVFVVGRPVAKPAPYFTNGWSFSEIARVPIVDTSGDFYELARKNVVGVRTDLLKRAQKSLQEITLSQSHLMAIFKKLAT